jgi:hypothetical protein
VEEKRYKKTAGRYLEIPFSFSLFFLHGPLPGGPQIQPGLNPAPGPSGPKLAHDKPFSFCFVFRFSSKTVIHRKSQNNHKNIIKEDRARIIFYFRSNTKYV